MSNSFKALEDELPSNCSTPKCVTAVKEVNHRNIKYKRTPTRAERLASTPSSCREDLIVCQLRYKPRSKRPYYDVDRIVDQKTGIRGDRWYRVRWLGYGSNDDSWLKAEDLNCPAKLKEFLDERRSKEELYGSFT